MILDERSSNFAAKPKLSLAFNVENKQSENQSIAI